MRKGNESREAAVAGKGHFVVRLTPICGFCRSLEDDCGVANARQGTTLAVLCALHSPPINSAEIASRSDANHRHFGGERLQHFHVCGIHRKNI
jgi:hypothetical protein